MFNEKTQYEAVGNHPIINSLSITSTIDDLKHLLASDEWKKIRQLFVTAWHEVPEEHIHALEEAQFSVAYAILDKMLISTRPLETFERWSTICCILAEDPVFSIGYNLAESEISKKTGRCFTSLITQAENLQLAFNEEIQKLIQAIRDGIFKKQALDLILNQDKISIFLNRELGSNQSYEDCINREGLTILNNAFCNACIQEGIKPGAEKAMSLFFSKEARLDPGTFRKSLLSAVLTTLGLPAGNNPTSHDVVARLICDINDPNHLRLIIHVLSVLKEEPVFKRPRTVQQNTSQLASTTQENMSEWIMIAGQQLAEPTRKASTTLSIFTQARPTDSSNPFDNKLYEI
jgi:hypothetical protein